MINIIRIFSIFILFVACSFVRAELKSLGDTELTNISGAGIGLVLEDFAFEGGSSIGTGNNRLDISGLQNSSGKSVVLGVSQFYVAGSGSNKGLGGKGEGVIGHGVNIGLLSNPFNIELLNGDSVGINERAVLEFSAPTLKPGVNNGRLVTQLTASRAATIKCVTTEDRTCNNKTSSNPSGTGGAFGKGVIVTGVSGVDRSALSSGPKNLMDLGIKFDITNDGIKKQSLQAHATGVAIDGSRIRLWGSDGDLQSNIAFKLVASQLELFATKPDGTDQGTSVNFQDVALNLELGYGSAQPLTFNVKSDGNFSLKLGGYEAEGSCKGLGGGNCALGSQDYNNFYNNGPRVDFYVNRVIVGDKNFGSSTISNLQIQYLEVNSRDI